ncbi:MAG: hypothetical protein ACREA9_03535 [Pyrinomonadaceae bacterium]
MRVAFAILMVVWLILKFILHKGGYVHMFLIAAISILIVQFIADRNARYHKTSDKRQSSV